MDKKTIDNYITEALGSNESAYSRGIAQGQAIFARIILSTVNHAHLTEEQKLQAIKAISEKIVGRAA